jgi:hypothetical protein
VLLLKALAAVAPVPRQEDFGLDAIATLICEDDKGDYLFAENSFYVQFKSDSERSVKYAEHGVRWLENLRLPFFIGHVNKKESAIDLYATHRLSQIFLEEKYEEVQLHFDQVDEGRSVGRKRLAYIGPPLMRWSTLDVAREGFTSGAYAILKPFLVAEERNIVFRQIRYCEPIRWKTNEVPEFGKSHMLAQSNVTNEDLVKAFDMMAPSLHAIAIRAHVSKDQEAQDIVVRTIGFMRRLGFDPDPNNIYASLYDMWRD